jgi:multidrug efflux pump
MTSVATVCGHFPLVLVTGPGAAARNSIGLVLVAGMAIGTAFTVFFVPAVYVLIAKTRRAEAHAEAPAPAGGEPEAATAHLREAGAAPRRGAAPATRGPLRTWS